MPVRDKEKYNAYMKEYMRQRYYRIRQEMLDELGGECVRCGSKENLEIDHKDPNSKEIDISDSHSAILYKKELEKCQLLCRSCHEEKTLEDRGQTRAQHGTITMYTHYRCRCEPCRIAAKPYTKRAKENYKRKQSLGP